MMGGLTPDEDLIRRLPLPLAQLYRDAQNARTPQDRHQAAYFLWEASLKMLGAVAVVAFAEREEHDPDLVKALRGKLRRPSIGHWWEIVRRLLDPLANGRDPGFRRVRDLLLGKASRDLPFAAGLYDDLLWSKNRAAGPHIAIRLYDLFEALVNHRNDLAHRPVVAGREGEYYERMGPALLRGVSEVLDRLDVLTGGRLIYVDHVSRLASGRYLVEGLELMGEVPRRFEPERILPPGLPNDLPVPGRVYLGLGLPPDLGARSSGDQSTPPPPALRSLHAMVLYKPRTREFYLYSDYNPDHDPPVHYHCYTSIQLEDRKVEPDVRASIVAILGLDEAADSPGPAAPVDAPHGPSCEAIECGEILGEFELLSELGEGAHGTVYRAFQPSLGREVALKCLHGVGDKESTRRFLREISTLAGVEHPHLVPIYAANVTGGRWFYAMRLIEGASMAAVFSILASRGDASHLDQTTWHEALSFACAAAQKNEVPLGKPPKQAPPPPPAADEGPFADAAEHPLAGRSYVRTAVEIMRQVAGAAHALHEIGVIHRDIKPSNIMLAAVGTHAVLMDLGVAHLAREPADNADGPVTTHFQGTLRYASPEQILDAAKVDRRSDVYSLGATLWELLCLRPIFKAADETNHTLMQRIILDQDGPGRVSKYHPGIAPDLERIVEKCLEKDPTRRYATADELADDLGRWLRGEPVRAQAPTLGYVAGKFVRRHQAILALTLPLLFTWLVWVPFLAVKYFRQRDAARESFRKEVVARREVEKQRNFARENFRKAEVARREAEQQRNLARESLRATQATVGRYLAAVNQPDLINMPGMEPLRQRLLGLAVGDYTRLSQENRNDPGLKAHAAKARYYVGLISEAFEKKEEVEGHYRDALRIQDELLRADPKNLVLLHDRAETGLQLARYDLKIDKRREAREASADVLHLLSPEVGPGGRTTPADPILAFDLARAFHQLGFIDEHSYSLGEARDEYQHSRTILDGLLRWPGLEEAQSLRYRHERATLNVNVGNLDRHQGRSARAEEAFRGAWQFWKERTSPDPGRPEFQPAKDPEYLTYCRNLILSLENLFDLEISLGRMREAEEFLDESSAPLEQLVLKYPYVEYEEYRARGELFRAWLDLERGWRAGRRADREEADRRAVAARVAGKNAQADFERFLKKDPERTSFREGLACSQLYVAASFAGSDWGASKKAAEEALRLYDALLPPPGRGEAKPLFRWRQAIGFRLLGDACAGLGRPGEADRAYREAGEALASLASSGVVDYNIEAGKVASSHARALLGGSPDHINALQARGLADRAIATLTDVLRNKDGENRMAQLELALAYRERALASARLGNVRAAAADIDEALRVARQRARAPASEEKELPIPLLYGLAAAYAQSAKMAGAANSVAEAINLLDEAGRTGARGPSRDRDLLCKLQGDPDFDPIRRHADFSRILRAWDLASLPSGH
jgi:serine/threonine protein kinase